MKLAFEFLKSQVKESFAQGGMNDSNQCPLCGLRTASERSTLTHLRSDHKRKESEIADLLSRAKAGSLGCDPAAKSLRKVIQPSSWNTQSVRQQAGISRRGLPVC